MPNGYYGPGGPFGDEEDNNANRLQTEYASLKKKHQKLLSAFRKMTALARKYKDLIAKVVAGLNDPPLKYGIFVRPHPNGRPNEADILRDSYLFKVSVVIPGMTAKDLKCGWEVLLGEGSAIVGVTRNYWSWGTEVVFKERIGPNMALVDSKGFNEPTQCYLSPDLEGVALKEGDRLLNCNGLLVRELPKTEEQEHFFDLDEITDFQWSMVGGLTKVVARVLREIKPLKDPKDYKEYFEGTDLNKGILLFGPPGCGKTLLAKCIAAEIARFKGTKCFFMELAAVELENMYVGETPRKIRELFNRAKEKVTEGGLVVIFLDEIESLLRRRDMSADKEPWMAGFVGQFNKILNGIDPLNNILVIGATNQKSLIDEAILRPGRLGIHIEVTRPSTREDIEQILRIYLSPTLPFEDKYFVEEYEYTDRFGDGEKKKVCLNSDREAIRQHIVDTVISRLLYTGQAIEVTMQEEGENETLVIDNKFVVETRTGAKVMYLKDNLSGAILAGIVETAKKIAHDRYVDKKEKAFSESAELRALRQQLNELTAEANLEIDEAKKLAAIEARDKKYKELDEALRALGIKPVVKKRDFFKAVDEELERLKNSDKKAKHRESRKMGFEFKK